MEREPTLLKVLAARGLVMGPEKGNYRREIRDSSGKLVAIGTVAEVWAWLHRQDDASACTECGYGNIGHARECSRLAEG